MKTSRLSVYIFLILGYVFVTLPVQAQTFRLIGTVCSASDKQPLIGASVYVKDSTRVTITDFDGSFAIRVKQGEVLVISYIGYVTQQVEISSGQTVWNIELEEDSQLLSEVVVVSYTPVKKATMTASVSSVTAQSKGRQSRRSKSIAEGVAAAPVAYLAPAPALSAYSRVQNEEYNSIQENGFMDVWREPLSTFSADVDVAAYSMVRRDINNGRLPSADVVRIEEMINYFSYHYPQPTGADPVHISTEVGACPWNSKHRLVRVGVKAREIADENLPASNLVFLIDVSGLMWGPTRLDLVKASLKLLVNNLRKEDKVSIVVYAGAAGEVLPATSGADKQKIREALDRLTVGGSTAGGAGIQLGYKIAEKNFIKGGNNRIILCTDGDFNVGVSSPDGLEKLIEQKRRTGVFLTVLGYGMGNYKDNRMQTLAEKGNGNYAYIENLQEANKVLVTEFGGTLCTVAKDVKLQVEFNPAHVQAYRLVGYESRLLAAEDFNDDTKDAGEMGAGHCVTAFYEVIPVGVESNWVGRVDDLKYQKKSTQQHQQPILADPSAEMLTVKLRYKDPDGDTSRKIEKTLIDGGGDRVSADFRFAASVAMFGRLLRSSDYKGEATYNKVVKLAEKGLDKDPQGYRREFIRLVKTVDGMAERGKE